MIRPARPWCAGLVILALVGACGPPAARPAPTPSATASSSSPDPDVPRRGPAYVALGDSYTAGGAIGELQEHGFSCQRSSLNYPSLVATTLDLPLTDVSCGGATSAGLLQPGQGVPAQADAVTPRAKVVTVGVGGNDFGLYTRLLLTCPDASAPGRVGSPCRDRMAADIARLVPAIGDQVGRALSAISGKAPDAEVLLVGYPRLMPSRGTCAQAPYTADDVAWIASVEAELAATLAAAARGQGVRFVPMYARSKGHDVCAGEDAWVNGIQPRPGDGLVLHPNAAGEKAMADAVVQALRGR